MCGIAGYTLSSSANAIDEKIVQKMTAALRHRGPDGHGAFVRPHVALGHARLSIIDVAGGAQPMKSSDGSLILSFNGEIYNYKELRSDLKKRGYRFTTASDTEVILHLYREYGESCLDYLNGMFAIALWDENRRQLLLARDRIGEKPLYYADVGGNLAFASELKALRHFPNVDLSLDFRAVDDYLAYGYVPSPRSIHHGIRKLPHAHYLTWRDGRFSIKRYWTVDSDIEIRSMSEAVERFQELLDDSVRIRLRSDVPVGSFLSGGLDSTLIVAKASQIYPGKMRTYTIGFGEDEFDESANASATAEHFSTEHTNRIVDSLSLDILPDLVRQYDEPFADPSSVPTYFVTREASRDLKVCLSGDGADELFGGYPQYRMEPFERMLLRFPRWLRRAGLSIPAAMLPYHVKGKGWLMRMMDDGALRYQQKIGVFSVRERQDLFQTALRPNIDEEAALLRSFFQQSSKEIENRQAADLATYLPDDILVKVDRSSMAHSLEVRTPYLDHRLVEFAAALPLRYKIADGVQKRVLRAALKPLVPSGTLERRKQGFALPLRDWFRGNHADFVGERLLSNSSKVRDVFDPTVVARLVEAHARGQRDFSERIWSLVWFEEWLGCFG